MSTLRSLPVHHQVLKIALVVVAVAAGMILIGCAIAWWGSVSLPHWSQVWNPGR